MAQEVSKHEDAPSLANAAINHFRLDDPPWIWDMAQEIWDIFQSRSTQERYGRKKT